MEIMYVDILPPSHTYPKTHLYDAADMSHEKEERCGLPDPIHVSEATK